MSLLTKIGTTPRRILITLAAVLATGAASAGPALASSPPGGGGIDTAGIAHLASSNVGKGACSDTTRHTVGFETSCHGNGGQPEYWCADFAKWVWSYYQVPLDGLTPAAHSFYDWALHYGGYTRTPGVGDVAMFSNSSSPDDIHHVAVVVAVNGANVTAMSGDWDGHGSTEAEWAGSSHVVRNKPFNGVPGSRKVNVGDMYLIGYAAP